MEAEYRRDFSHSYLIVRQQDSHSYQNYSWKMLTENSIPGLVSCECRRIDEEVLFYYDVTSKISLKEKCAGTKINSQEIYFLLRCILKVLDGMEEYLLPEESLCLQMEYIYVDASMNQVEFCYVPGETWNLEKSMRCLLEELLLVLDHTDQKSAADVYKIYQYIVNEKFSLEEIEKQLQFSERENENIKQKKLNPSMSSENQYISEKKNGDMQKEDFPEEIFQKEETKQHVHKSSFLIDFFAIVVIAEFLSGWYLWRNYPDYMWVWIVIGGMTLFIMLLGFLVSRRKKEVKNEAKEKIPMEEKNKNDAEPEWEYPFENEECDNFTTVLDQKRLSSYYLESVGYQRECLQIGDKEIQFLGHLEGKVDLLLPSQAVNRIHARLRKSDEKYYLRDMNSKNGTWVNQQELVGECEVVLKDGDEIRFADLSYYFRKM